MASARLLTFSRITENYLYFKMDYNWQPRVRKNYIVKMVVYCFLTYRMLRWVTINSEDTAQHIQQGNFCIGLTLHTDLLVAPGIGAGVVFKTLICYHIYLLRYRPHSLLFMTKVVGEYFEGMSDNQQASIIYVAQVVRCASCTSLASFIAYATYNVIATYDTTLWQSLQLIMFAGMVIQ